MNFSVFITTEAIANSKKVANSDTFMRNAQICFAEKKNVNQDIQKFAKMEKTVNSIKEKCALTGTWKIAIEKLLRFLKEK